MTSKLLDKQSWYALDVRSHCRLWSSSWARDLHLQRYLSRPLANCGWASPSWVDKARRAELREVVNPIWKSSESLEPGTSEWRRRQNWGNRFWSFASSSELYSKYDKYVNWHWKDSDFFLWVKILNSIFEEAVLPLQSTRKCQESADSKPTIWKVSKVYFIRHHKSACVLMKSQVLKTNRH